MRKSALNGDHERQVPQTRKEWGSFAPDSRAKGADSVLNNYLEKRLTRSTGTKIASEFKRKNYYVKKSIK